MEKTVYKINEESLREVLEESLKNAHQFEWTGWRIPLYLDEEDGTVSAGSWLSNSSWQPDAIEIPVKVETWSMNDRGYSGDLVEKELEEGEEGYYQEDFDYELNELVDYLIGGLEEYEDPNYEWELI